MVKMYFKSGSGILNPTDKDGNEIKEGDILTHNYYIVNGEYDTNFFSNYYPDFSIEKINEVINKPSVIVRYNENGYFYGEGLIPRYEDYDKEKKYPKRLYMHDFCFKETKRICNINDNERLYQTE